MTDYIFGSATADLVCLVAFCSVALTVMVYEIASIKVKEDKKDSE